LTTAADDRAKVGCRATSVLSMAETSSEFVPGVPPARLRVTTERK